LALTEQVATIDKRRIIRKMGNIKLKSLFKIGTALMIGLGLNNNTFKKGIHK
jgi:mRNA-degrading endonuclease toxin of MazEF toxin-antitoxin module